MKFVSLIIATISSLTLLISLLKGKKYEVYIDNLDSGEHPLKSLYVAGYCLSDTKLFGLRGNIGKRLKRDANILY